MSRLLAPHAEVVLHDAGTDRVLRIWHPLTPRAPGEASLLGDLDGHDDGDVHGPYEKLLADGRRLSSVSAVLRDDTGAPEVVLCVNLDRTPLEQAAAVLSGFGAPVTERPGALFEQDWADRIERMVGAFVRERGRPVGKLSRDERRELLTDLDEAGLLAVRRSAPVVARALGVSRSTLYSLLADLPSRRSSA